MNVSEHKEKTLIENILSMSFHKGPDTFGKVKKLLIDAEVIIENENFSFRSKKSISLREITKVEEILGIKLISIPTEKEWLIINRREKLEQINENKNTNKL